MANPVQDVAVRHTMGISNDVTNDTPGSGDEGVEPVVPANEAEPVVTPTDPKDDPKRMEYWQSRADKMAAQNKELEKLVPLQKLLNERPDVVEVIREKINPDAKKEPPKPEIVKPDAPKKPSDYDSVAAVSDPESPSFQYRTSLEAYQEQLLNFYDKRESARQEQFDRERVQIERREQAARADAVLRSKLQEQGIIGDEANKFIEKMDSPDVFDLNNLVKYYKVVYGASNVPAPPDPKREAIERRNNSKRVPLPVGIDSGGGNPPEKEPSVDQIVNESFLAVGREMSRKRGPVIKEK